MFKAVHSQQVLSAPTHPLQQRLWLPFLALADRRSSRHQLEQEHAKAVNVCDNAKTTALLEEHESMAFQMDEPRRNSYHPDLAE